MNATKGHSYHGRVAWSDTDTGGVAYFGSYARWVEYAEAELWRAAGLPMAEVLLEGKPFPDEVRERFAEAGYIHE